MSTRTLIGTGGLSISSVTLRKQTKSIRASTSSTPISKDLKNAAGNYSFIMVGLTSRSPRGSTVEFYESAVKLSAAPTRASNWIRLFMVPGMGHCSGGEGPDTFDMLSALEQWVEQGKPPRRIIAAHYSLVRKR